MPSISSIKATLSALSLSIISGPASFSASFQELPDSHRSFRSDPKSSVQVRAEVYLNDGTHKPVPLGGRNFSTKRLNELLNSEYESIINGSFFRTGRTAGDLIGAEISNPSVPLNRPFKSNDKSLNAKVYGRYYFGVTTSGEWVIGRRSEIIDANGKPIPQGKDLSSQFSVIIGGLAYIGIESPAIQRALVRGDRESIKFFRESFNIWNQNYNGIAAYDGLQGARTRPRTAVILGNDNSSGIPVMIKMSIGRGTSELSGVSLFSLARNGFYLCKKYSCTPKSMVLFDGGSSVCFGSKSINSEGKVTNLVIPSSATPLSGFAMKSLKDRR